MTASAKVKEFISNLPEGKPFPSTALRQIAATENIRQILNRLVFEKLKWQLVITSV